MSFPLVAKVSSGVIGIGALTGDGIFVAYKTLNQETITKYLNSLNRELASSDADWELIKTNYAADKADSSIPNIPKSDINNKLNELKKWCSDRLNEKFSKERADKGDYNLIQAWCTKQIKISSHLKNLNLEALDTSSGNKDDITWNKLKDSYASNSFKVNAINTSNSNKTEGEELSTIDNIQKIKDWCSWASDQYFKYKEDSLFKRYEHFCTKAIEQ